MNVFLNKIIGLIKDFTKSDYVFLLKNSHNDWKIIGSHPNGIEAAKNFDKKIKFVKEKLSNRSKISPTIQNEFIYEFGKFINEGKDIFYYNSEICQDLDGVYYLSLYGDESFEKKQVFTKRFSFFKDLLKYYLQYGGDDSSFNKIFELLYDSGIYFIFISETGKVIFDNFSEFYEEIGLNFDFKIENLKCKFLLSDRIINFETLVNNDKEYNGDILEFFIPNGTKVCKSLYKKVIKDSSNNFTGSFISLREIDEKVIEFETLLLKSKESRILYYAFNVENRAFRFFQKDIQEFLSIDEKSPNLFKFFKRIHPYDFLKYKNFARDALKGKHLSVEFRLYDSRKDIKYIKQTVYPIFKNDNLELVLGIIEDQTNVKLLENKIFELTNLFDLLFESSNQFLFFLDEYGKFTKINPRGLEILGYKEEEIIGKHFLEFASDDSKYEAAVAFKNILESSKPIDFEIWLECKYVGKRLFKIRAIKFEQNNSVVGMIGSGFDASELKRLEEKNKDLNFQVIELNRLLSIEKDRAKEQNIALEEINRLRNEFISNISHELRTPLASIIGFAETILADPSISKDLLQEFAKVILQEGKRLNNVINIFLDLSKIERGEFSIVKYNFNIVETLNEIVDKFEEQIKQKGIKFSIDMPSKKIEINGDKDRLTDCISHLLSNAIKFTPSGGRISLIAKDFQNEFEIIISDTGVGIPKEDLDKIFNRFYKYKKSEVATPGTGLSLALVKKIIDLHKGVILVKSDINKGASFIIKLPKILNK